jgi:hypothetical protein
MHPVPAIMLVLFVAYCGSAMYETTDIESFGWLALAVMGSAYLVAMMFDGRGNGRS